MSDHPINVALVAYGMSGRVFHAPLLSSHTGFDLKKILVRNGSRLLNEKYPDVLVVKALEDLLQDPDTELVIVNTPEHTHYELAKQALSAGKHVVVEKAFTVTSAQGEELTALAKEKNRVLSVFQNSRWHGDFITIQRIVEERLLGKLVEFESHYDRYRNFIQTDSWKEDPVPGTGSLYNLGSHMIDQALVLFGSPRSLMADLRTDRPEGKVCDHFELILYYDELKVTLKSSYLVREPGPRYVLHGTEGSFVKYGGDPQEALLKSGKSPLDPDFGYEDQAYWGRINTQVSGLHLTGQVETCRGSYMGFYDNVHEAIRKGRPLNVAPEQALQTIKIIELAMKSHAEGRVIALDAHAATQ